MTALAIIHAISGIVIISLVHYSVVHVNGGWQLFIMSFAVSQAAMLGIGASLGNAPEKYLAMIGGSMVLGIAYSYTGRMTDLESPLLYSIGAFAMAIAAMACTALMKRLVRLRRVEPSSRVMESGRVRFSLRNLFALTFAVAVVAALNVGPEGVGVWTFLMFLLATLAAAEWACLADGNPWVRSLLVLVFVTVVVVQFFQAMIFFQVYASVLLASLAYLRKSGYHLRPTREFYYVD